MRGCLSVLIIAAAFVVGILWFGGPPIAATVVQASLTGAGFQADELSVSVSADPPLVLAVGRADRVIIEATGVRWNDLRAGSMTMRLDGVDLVGRSAASTNSRFDDVELAMADGNPALVGISIVGPTDRAGTEIVIDRVTVNEMALAAFEQTFGTRPDSVELVAPDQIRVRLGGNALGGTLRVEADGALIVASSLGSVRLVEPNPSIPFRLTGVSAGGHGLELTGTTDLASLLR